MSSIPGQLEAMLSRLKLHVVRDQLDNLLDEAAKKDFTMRETLTYTYLCKVEVDHKENRRVTMGTKIAHLFEAWRTLTSRPKPPLI